MPKMKQTPTLHRMYLQYLERCYLFLSAEMVHAGGKLPSQQSRPSKGQVAKVRFGNLCEQWSWRKDKVEHYFEGILSLFLSFLSPRREVKEVDGTSYFSSATFKRLNHLENAFISGRLLQSNGKQPVLKQGFIFLFFLIVSAIFNCILLL